MKFLLVKPAPPASSLRGEILLLGDKSIANRSVIISAISYGKTIIENFPASKDCLATINTFRKLGIKITQKPASQSSRDKETITVFGRGLYGLKRPKGNILVGDSGTTLRLALGVLAGQDFTVTLAAGKSLSKRPMRRVTYPLRTMGAKIESKVKRQESKAEEYPPITIRGGNLRAITYKMPIASSQVKSAILFAGLYTKGLTSIIEPIKTRDHTERMLKLFKAKIKFKQNTIIIEGNKELVSPGRIFVPADISSASFFIVLATLLPNARILIKSVSLNPTRTGIIKVLKRMGADIRVRSSEFPPQADQPTAGRVRSYEPIGDIIVRSSQLKGTVVRKEEIPSLIDELPILMVAACFARGETTLEGVSELRVKETDRIRSMSDNLRAMGADINVVRRFRSEKIVIRGSKRLRGAKVKSFQDHRTAMSMVVAGLRAEGRTTIDDITCINKSFPNFLTLLKPLIH